MSLNDLKHDNPEEWARLRKQERQDNKAEVVIENKNTGEVEHRARKYWDEAERYAKNYIWNRPYLKYKIYHVGNEEKKK